MEQYNSNSALLIMDMLSAILRNLPDSAELRNNVSKAAAYAREKKIPVIYVVVSFRAGTPEISADNKIFAAGRERFTSTGPEEFSKIDPSVAPHPGEIIVTKRRISAFTGSDLEVVLRAQGIRHLILCGVATGGVVLSTVREAADKDFVISVLSDCCADADEEIHRVLTAKVFPRQADVLTLNEWINK